MLGEKQQKLIRKHWKKPFSGESVFKLIQDSSKDERIWEDDTKVNCCRLNLHQKRIPTVRTVKKQNKFPGEIVESPLMKVFKNGLDKSVYGIM